MELSRKINLENVIFFFFLLEDVWVGFPLKTDGVISFLIHHAAPLGYLCMDGHLAPGLSL